MNFVRSHIEPFYTRLTGAQWVLMFIMLTLPTAGFFYVLTSVSPEALTKYLIIQAVASFVLFIALAILDTVRLGFDIARGTRKERFSNAAYTIICTSYVWLAFIDYILIKHMHT